MRNSWKLGLFAGLCASVAIVGCSDDDGDNGGAGSGGGGTMNKAGSSGSAGKANGGSSSGNGGGEAGSGGSPGTAGTAGTSNDMGGAFDGGTGGTGGEGEGEGGAGGNPPDCTETCENQTCVAAAGSASCTGVCAPGQFQCAADGLGRQPCNAATGEWDTAVACVSQACPVGKTACEGSCTPGTKKCSGDGVQTCNAAGQYPAAVACGTETPVCSGAGVCGVPPSCSGLAATCGADGNATCCASSVVPGGTFNRSNNAGTPATVANFRLDTYEVTVGRFRKFVAAYSQSMIAAEAGKNPNNAADPGWDTAWNASLAATALALTTAVKCDATYQSWTDTAGTAAAESLPMNCMSWFEAEAFCIWDGGRLPTEAEWNYAAAGGTAQRTYPWGSTAPDCSYANFQNTDYCVLPGTGRVNRVGSEAPKGDGTYGQSDLAGNVWEWVQDYYHNDLPTQNPCDNCANLTVVDERVIRGGSFRNNASYLLLTHGGGVVIPWSRYDLTPSSRVNNVGARCARTP